MVLIAGTEFFMGVAPGDHGMEPGSLVKVGSFFIDKLEVTAAQYSKCVAATQCNAPAARARGCTTPRAELAGHPVNCVDWYEADRYCRAQDKRLPTRAEWELAARGKDRRIYPWGNEEPGEQLCWQGRKGKDAARTCPVGTFPAGASPYGVLDMAGNVAEWTATDGRSAVGRSYVAKGGGFVLDPLESPDFREVRSDAALPLPSSMRDVTVGLRCAKDAAPAAP
jgi:formylglycine-generating enzyme required for sulfatase activity